MRSIRMMVRELLKARRLFGECSLPGAEADHPDILTILYRERTTTNLQLISDCCDLCVPSSALGYTNLDDGIVGLAGTMSSLIGVYTTWKKTAA